LRKHKIIQSYLDTEYKKATTKRNIYNSIIVALLAYSVPQYVVKKYIENVEKLNKKINEHYATHEMTDIERNNFIKWEDVLIKREEMRKIHEDTPLDLENLQNYLIICLYSYIPPIRNEYGSVIKWSDASDSNDNYFCKNKKIILLQKYKTVKRYGEKIIPIPDIIVDLIEKREKISPTKFLLTNVNGGILGTNLITNRLNKIFGKNVSSSLLRKSYISHIIGFDIDKQKLRVKLADQMMHSVGMAEGIYNKNLN
jgi:hypothetical protein